MLAATLSHCLQFLGQKEGRPIAASKGSPRKLLDLVFVVSTQVPGLANYYLPTSRDSQKYLATLLHKLHPCEEKNKSILIFSLDLGDLFHLGLVAIVQGHSSTA